MKVMLTWQPVLEKLPLKKYNPAVSTDDHFMVCVNPDRSFMDERAALMREFASRFDAYSKALKDKDEAAIEAFNEWSEQVFNARVNDWYARLLSYGDDKYTAEDLAEYGRVDAHFLNWLYAECIQMIEAHKSNRKKN